MLTAAEAKIPPGERAAQPIPRSLSTLASDLQSFMTSGADLSKAKEHNNVIGPVFFDIPLDQVNYSMLTIFNLNLHNFCKFYGAQEL